MEKKKFQQNHLSIIAHMGCISVNNVMENGVLKNQHMHVLIVEKNILLPPEIFYNRASYIDVKAVQLQNG